MLNVFEHTDYKEVIFSDLETNGSKRGYKQRLATVAGCHPSYLSQVISSHVNLLPEHGLKLADFWQLSAAGKQYFLNLVLIARSGQRELTAFLKSQNESLRQKESAVARRITRNSSKSLVIAQQAQYYSDWRYCAIHIICSIAEYSTPEAIGQRLGLGGNEVRKVLNQLGEMNLVAVDDQGAWSACNFDLHISKDSPLLGQHHTNWRLYSRSRTTEIDHESNTIYTSVVAISAADRKKIQKLLLDFIAKSRRVCLQSKEENLCCLQLDFFEI